MSDKPIAIHLTHADMKDRPLPCIVYEINYAWCRGCEDEQTEAMVASPVTVTAYGPATGCTTPTVCITYSDGIKARASLELFYLTEAQAQAQMDKEMASEA